jgi:predicted SPOUT superfamily RNA methylase MTH1
MIRLLKIKSTSLSLSLFNILIFITTHFSTRFEDDNQLMVKILEYLECPQYLRKSFFPSQKLLEFVGLLNPLDAPHHFRLHDEWEFREGVTTDIPCKEESGTWVDVGLMHVSIRLLIRRIKRF